VDDIWTLKRSAADGKVAGLCAAIAARYRVDPFLVRIVMVLLALSAGLGLALYSAGWLVLPTDRDPVPPVQRMLPAVSSLSRTAVLVGTGVWTVVVMGLAGQFLTLGFGPVLVIGALWWFGVIRPRQAIGTTRPPAIASRTERDFVHAAQAWRVRVDEQVRGIDWHQPSPLSAAPAMNEWRPPPTWVAQTTPVAPQATPAAPSGHAPSDTIGRHRRRALWVVTIGVVLLSWSTMVTTGVLGAVPYVATALLVVGLALVMSAWIGRPRGLLPVAILLLIALVAAAGPSQAAGTSVYLPSSAADLPPTISHPVGDVVIDLSSLDEPVERTVTVRVAAGDVRIVCPESMNLDLRSQVAAGSFTLFETTTNGPGSFGFAQEPDPDRPTLILDIEVALGDLVVTRS
jgi:phage shock protein PspC (stress-responsive transcriptional regulator)